LHRPEPLRSNIEEIIVAAGIGRYIASANLPTGRMPGGVATHIRIIGKLLAAASGRNARQQRSYEPEAERLSTRRRSKNSATQ
jgi:hypothetical protein